MFIISSMGAVHRTDVYFEMMSLKDPTLERYPDIKIYIYIYIYMFTIFLVSGTCNVKCLASLLDALLVFFKF
jgi:hypothetical protein